MDLSEGSQLVISGEEWEVTCLHAHLGRVRIRPVAGSGLREEKDLTIRALLHHPDCRPSTSTARLPASSRGRQPVILQDLTDAQREIVAIRYAHVMEAETGFRSGEPLRALPGEPRPGYDPDTTTRPQRRQAKAAELSALPTAEARMLGLEHVSARTLRRWAENFRRHGIAALINGSWVRRMEGHHTISPEVREAVIAVRRESLRRSRISMKTKYGMICQYVADKFGPEIAVPSYTTLWRVWREWFGPSGGRAKYLRSAAALEDAQGKGITDHVVVHRPGQVVALDTTEMAVLVRESVFGDPVPVYLTLALDVYTHSIVAFRLTLVSDTSTDVAMLLRDIMMPLPLREGWGEDMEWPYPGVPASLVAEFAGRRVAALPFFAPETVTTDHGSVYKNHHLIGVQRLIGCNILPARVLRPTDKAAVERCFAAIQSLLFEYLPGWRGVDVADRGADPEADAVLTIDELEHLFATWIVKIWQNRELGGHSPAWDPGGQQSPNTLFAAALQQGGFALQVPADELYYDLLRPHLVAIDGKRGVKIRGLWYASPDLPEGPSARGGAHKREWVVRSDPRDRRHVFFQDPQTHAWHALRWTGLPPEGEVPAFGDTRVTELLKAARARGLKPRSDAELLPLLLELIGARIPVDSWPTQMSKRERTEHSREVLQARAAAGDRPPAPSGPADDTVIPFPAPEPAAAGKAGWRERAADVSSTVDRERARRRREAVPGRAAPAPRMNSRRPGLFAVPDDGAGETGGEMASDPPAQAEGES